MISHPDLSWDDTGQTTLSGRLGDYLTQIEDAFAALARQFGCEAVQPPALLGTATLARLDYLHSFPQHATFACCLANDDDNLRRFAQGDAVAGGHIHLTELAPANALLLPAACYSLYPWLAQRPQQRELRAFTVQARCFRREQVYAPLERQWNFTMRELVCLGNAEEVQRFLKRTHQQLLLWCDRLQLPVQTVQATDPFFDPARNPGYLMQRVAPSKLELEYGGDLAIGSINYHRQYFGEAFSLHAEGETLHSGCVAFGLERWLAAMLRQHGAAVENWPRMPHPEPLAEVA